MAVDWSYFDRFDKIIDKYMPSIGQGETEASQIVTAVNKLIYKWYNDGDVFDNTYYMYGWGNDLSSYANWLDQNTAVAGDILWNITSCWDGDDYEGLLMELADTLFDEAYLEKKNQMKKHGDIYHCDGRFKFEEYSEEDD